jgi:hypothetical protein
MYMHIIGMYPTPIHTHDPKIPKYATKYPKQSLMLNAVRQEVVHPHTSSQTHSRLVNQFLQPFPVYT